MTLNNNKISITKKLILILGIVFFVVQLSMAQDETDIESFKGKWEEIKKAKPVDVHGGFNSQFGFNQMIGMPLNREPFIMALNANLRFNFYGIIDMPMSINYNNRQVSRDMKNPLKEMWEGIISKTGFSPKYKWVTLHLGERSMNFSQYTYSGIMFYGVGLELKPPKSIVDFSSFFGRLQKPLNPDTLRNTPMKPTYERWGSGAKIGLGKKKHRVELMYFHAKDKVNSIDTLSPIYGVKPLENLVVGISTKNNLFERINIKGDYIMSAYTSDLRTPIRRVEEEYNYFNNLGDLFRPMLSTRYNRVFIIGIDYTADLYNIGVSRKRVDPTFVSLGSLSVDNDVEEYTINGSIALFESKVNLSGNVGKQYNNLDRTNLNQMSRFIYAANISYLINKNWNVSGNYSNNSSSTSPTYLNLIDSIKLMQLNQNFATNVSYNFGEKLKHAFMVGSNLQLADDIQDINNSQTVNSTKVQSHNAGYSLLVPDWQTNSTLSYMLTIVDASGMKNLSRGPNLQVRKTLWEKKISINIGGGMLENFVDNQSNGNTINFRFGAMLKLEKYHSVKFDNSIIRKNDTQNPDKSFTDIQWKLGYNFDF